jgi:hypothetical protein
MAKGRVNIDGKSVLIEVFPRRGYGGHVFDGIPVPGDTPSHPPRPGRGRPRKDTKAARINELRDNQKKSWSSLDELIAAEFPGTATDAPRSLYRSRQRAGGIRRNRMLEQVFLQLIESWQPRVLRLPKRRGRPRKDGFRAEVRQMYINGNNPEQIAMTLNSKYGQTLATDYYRRLCSPAAQIGPWRKLDLNFIRGK